MVINQYRKCFSYSFINTGQCPILICVVSIFYPCLDFFYVLYVPYLCLNIHSMPQLRKIKGVHYYIIFFFSFRIRNILILIMGLNLKKLSL